MPGRILKPFSLAIPLLLMAASLMIACNNSASVAGKSVSDSTAAVPAEASSTDLSFVKLPPGFKISVYAQVPGARSMCWGKNTLFVGSMTGGGKVYAVTDKDGNGVADQVYTIATGLNTPNGVAFRDGSLYVAEISRILRFDDIENHLSQPPSYSVVYDKLPRDTHHGWKFIAFGPDGKLYVPVGAPCNICDEKNPVYASICRMNPDGTGFEIFARGIRNTVGFDWDPSTKNLWFTDNGRDNLGDDIPSDELNMAPHKGLHFGYPYCHQGDIPDPEFGKGKNCADYVAPVVKMGPHVAALGLRFYTGKMFPADYHDRIFIAQHGSWNRTQPIGYRVMTVKLKNGKAVDYQPFATGWLDAKNKVLGRPVDVEVAPDGSLLVSDDRKGVIYRISKS